MFTGLVEEMGEIVAGDRSGDAPSSERQSTLRLRVAATTVTEGARIGDSISPNGCCLTVIDLAPDRRQPPNYLGTDIREVRYGDFAGRIEAEYRSQGEALRDSIIAAAEAKAVQIKEQAATAAAAEARVAMQELRAQLADSVIAAAKASLEKKLTAKDQDKLVDEYLTKVVFN